MKLILLTSTYGGRICVRVQYSYQVYFAGEQPPDNRLITLDLPNLKSYLYHDVLTWLKENSNLPSDSRRDVSEFPENCWRKAVLDDYIEAGNYNETLWVSYQHFFSQDFTDFGDKWLGVAQEKLKSALQNEVGLARIKAFEGIQNFLERVYFVMDKTPYGLTQEINKMQETIDQAEFDEIVKQTDSLEELIKTAEKFKAETVRQNALNYLSNEIVKRRLTSEEIYKLLLKFGVNLRQATSYYNNRFWDRISHLLKFEQNVTNQTVDLTEATEEKVQYSWDLLNAKRIGQIGHNRNALVIRNKTNGQPKLYVSGERKLKFQIQRNGGSLQKFGCTLTIAEQDNSSIQPALLEVEKIDALANLDINQALEKVAHLNLPNNHLVYYTAERAKTNPKQARVLADLLIELLVGVDADIARNLARAQARGNRK